MKITIEHEGLTASVEDKAARNLAHALDLLRAGLTATGFYFSPEDQMAVMRGPEVIVVEDAPPHPELAL